MNLEPQPDTKFVSPLPAHEAEFQTWWEREGTELCPVASEASKVFIKNLCKVAWLNGAYVALERLP